LLLVLILLGIYSQKNLDSSFSLEKKVNMASRAGL